MNRAGLDRDRPVRTRGRADGEFAYSLTLTDIHTAWTERNPCSARARPSWWMRSSRFAGGCPSSSGPSTQTTAPSPSIHHLRGYCETLKIQVTRGRPYKKDDNAHVERKNWTHVRRLMGYLRYDSPKAVVAMNELYRGELRCFQNLHALVEFLGEVLVGLPAARYATTSREPLWTA